MEKNEEESVIKKWILPAGGEALKRQGPLIFILIGIVLQWCELSRFHMMVILFMVWISCRSLEEREIHLEEAMQNREEAEIKARRRINARLENRFELTTFERVLINELDSRTWLDSICGTIYRKYKDDLSKGLKDILDDVLASLCPLGPIDSLVFSHFDLGQLAPRILRVTSPLLANTSEVMLDLDLEHIGARVNLRLLARLGGSFFGITIPLALTSVSLQATARVKIQLVERSPYIGILDIAFAAPPKQLDFNLKALVDLTGLPSVAEIISNKVKNILIELMCWPERISLPLDEWFHPTSVPPPIAAGVLRVTVDCAADLPSSDLDGYSDPWAKLEVSAPPVYDGGTYQIYDSARTRVKPKNLSPKWNEAFTFLLKDPTRDKLSISIFDYDAGSSDDLLGFATIPSQVLTKLCQDQTNPRRRVRSIWIVLEHPKQKKGHHLKKASAPPRVRLILSYGPLYPRKIPSIDQVNDDEISTNLETTCPECSLGCDVNDQADDEKTFDESGQSMGLEDELLRRLYTRSSVCLNAGIIRKGRPFGTWRTRCLELDLTLEYNNGLLQAAATVRLLRAAQANEVDDEDGENDDDDEGQNVTTSKKSQRHVVAEKRLNPLTDGVSDTSSTIVGSMNQSESKSFSIKCGGKLMRIKCETANEKRHWVTVIEHALTIISLEQTALDRLINSVESRLLEAPAEIVEGKRRNRNVFGGASLSIEIIQARNLLPKDASGLSDPYVLATLRDQEFKTRIVQQSLEPKWYEFVEFSAGIFDKAQSFDSRRKKLDHGFAQFFTKDGVLKLQVFDDDGRRKSELMGTLKIRLSSLLPRFHPNDDFTTAESNAPRWYPLQPPPNHNSTQQAGEILVRINIRRCRIATLEPASSLANHINVVRAVGRFTSLLTHTTGHAVLGVGSAVSHPVKTVSTIAGVVKHPKRTVSSITGTVLRRKKEDEYNDFETDDLSFSDVAAAHANSL